MSIGFEGYTNLHKMHIEKQAQSTIDSQNMQLKA